MNRKFIKKTNKTYNYNMRANLLIVGFHEEISENWRGSQHVNAYNLKVFLEDIGVQHNVC